jgi:predicted phage tail protein
MGLDLIHGAKGGSSAHTPVEAPDTLRSIEDLLSEGEISGLVNGLQSVKLDGTPVANPDGSLNFTGVSVQVRPGTQDQAYIPGYGSVKNEIAIATELKSDNPWVRQLANTALSACAITLQVDALQRSNTSNGDINGYLVQLAIDVSTDNGAYVTVLNVAFNGKSSSTYQRTVRIDLPRATTGWNVRVRRLTANANSATVADTTRIMSLTEIIDAKLRYPNSAYVAISGDASQFSNIPARSYVVFGRLIRVPSNYDPQTRIYSGVWDGSFKVAWTNNPAWIFYDIVVQNRFGLGDLIDASLMNKWELYRIGVYCDQLVDDGKGGQEPRFTCNTCLQAKADAFRLLGDLASVFRGVSYWMGGAITTVADMPEDPVYAYNATNVIDGRFTYQSSARKTRFTTALVTYNDPTNSYKPVPEYVPDNEGIARYGIQPTEFVAFGCTSQGQAHRAGLWALTTSRYETDSVTFAVGLEGLKAAPGKKITVQDPNRAGARQGGRISAATDTVITVDRAPDMVSVGDTLTVLDSQGVAQTRTISGINGRDLQVGQAFTEAPVAQSVWHVASVTLAVQTFRILNVTEDVGAGKIQFTINAVQHNPSKYARIESGAAIQVPPISRLPTGTQKPATDVTVSSHVVVEATQPNIVMTIAWTAAEGAASYKVEWQKDNGQWIQAGTVSTTSVDVIGIYTGTYIARVTAINSGNTASLAALSAATPLQGKTGAPPALTSLTTESLIFGIRINWTFPPNATDTARTEIWASTKAGRPTEQGEQENPDVYHLGDYAYPGNTTEIHGLMAGTSLFFWGRIVDKAGNVGPWYPTEGAVNGQSSSDAAAILSYLTGQITKSQLGQDLLAPIEAAEGLASFIQPPAPWESTSTYAAGASVSYAGQLWLALAAVPAGTAPGSDPTLWRSAGSVEQTAAGLALQMSATNLKVETLDGQVQTTAEKTDSVYAQVNSQSVNDLTSAAGDLTDLPMAGYYVQTIAQVKGDLALGKRIETTQASIGAVAAAVTVETQARVDAISAQASQITTIQATTATASAAAQLAYNTAVNVDGRVSASIVGKVGVTTDGKYYQAGFAIGLDNSGGTVQSQFLVTADTFAILPTTAGGNAVAPLIVQGGQVFLNQALIGTGWINSAMIGNQIASTAVNASGLPVWEINKSGTRYVRGNQFTITEDVNGWRMTNAAGIVVIEMGAGS